MSSGIRWFHGCALLALLIAAAAGCDNSAQAEPAQPERSAGVAQADFNILNETVRQNQTKVVALEQAKVASDQAQTQESQRIAALEQRMGALQQSIVNITNENQQMAAQLAQTQAELAATQEQVRRLSGQAARARQAVRQYTGR